MKPELTSVKQLCLDWPESYGIRIRRDRVAPFGWNSGWTPV